MMTNPTDNDWAEQARTAEQDKAWLQAASLWLRASETCSDVFRALRYAHYAQACNRRLVTEEGSDRPDEVIEKIAKRLFHIPTSQSQENEVSARKEFSIEEIKRALRAAYEAGRQSMQ